MTALKYWDAGSNQWIVLPTSSPGLTYTQVQATAPNPNAPVLAPPNGALWVDTSTATPGLAAYVPSQAPPASGNNSFTDAAGELWVSRNASPWRKARDAVRMRCYSNASPTIPTSSGSGTVFLFNTLDPGTGDLFATYATGTGVWTCPFTGVYQVSAMLTAMHAAAAGAFFTILIRNGSPVQRGTQTALPASGDWGSTINDQVHFNAADTMTINVFQNTGQNITGYSGFVELYTLAVHFLSPG
jgi:hypothetical protein